MYSAYKSIDAAVKPLTAAPQTPVREVVKMMYTQGKSAAVVVDQDNRPIGIFTERDVVRVVATGGDLDAPVEEYMTRNPVAVRDNESLTKALALMIEHRVRHLPVVDQEGKLVGIITASSITEVLKRYKEEVGELE
ncbi:conserved hypothetical protein [Aeropyrum pernix K1]|uniref:CBS domain-containing protein n=1 Tax=Aeropyrum pernix (strain ATCC 700893 / DSM 11879 / JCM 9820 / NBRC 100138 / K1) TaxID=272557 RepID=Q9YAV6_AERPE|nr:CBS domain-containing protein [Aeropyrum pernix]BAA80842.2 conserved hypothetical protein [Aeropyrum pernix K1]